MNQTDLCARCDHQRQEHRPRCGVTTFSSLDLREPHDCPCDGFLDLPALRARLSAVEAERDLLLSEHPAGVKHFRRRALTAEARVEALSEALREIARREVIAETTAGHPIDSPVHGREEANAIARAALAALPERQEQSRGATLIAVERLRQVEAEGWTAEHDRKHLKGDLARAGAAYALNDESFWPWDGDASWNPGSDLRRLVKAGALIAAEIDRLAALPVPEQRK